MICDRAELEWPMVTIWPWRDVNKLSFLQHVDSVPFAFRYDARLARMQFDRGVRRGFAGDLEASRNHIQYLVPIGMDFASVRSVIRNRNDAHGHAIDSGWRARLMRSGGNGKVTVNVKQETRNINWDNSVYQAILLSSLRMPGTERWSYTATTKLTSPSRATQPLTWLRDLKSAIGNWKSAINGS